MAMLTCLVHLGLIAAAAGQSISLRLQSGVDDAVTDRPSPWDPARMARWLVSSTTWGTLATLRAHTKLPNGGLKSHSDWVDGASTGRLFLYLSPMDVSTQDLMADSHASYTVSEVQLEAGKRGTCHGVDPEDPTCAKVTLIGEARPVPEAERQLALAALFARHPSMEDWPAGHHFMPYELHVGEAHLLDWYGGIKVITAHDYYAVQLKDRAASS